MKKILVTGATGFIGYHVAKKLAEKNWGEIFCLVRPQSEKKFIQKLPVKIAEGDLRDKSSLERALNECELLFHVAADYRLWSKDPEELIQSNVQGTENILTAARAAGIKKVVYTSSVAAVGRPHIESKAEMRKMKVETKTEEWERKFCGNERMYPTDEQLIGPYKQSKYLAELVARKFAQDGLPVVIVNPSTPVGSHDFKPTPTGKLILDFLNRKMPAYVETGLNLVDVEDVAEGHLLAAEKGKNGERYILGKKNLMLKEILDLLEKITGLPAPRFKIPYWLAYCAGALSTACSQVTGAPPAIPLDGVKMARDMMFYDASKAVRELGLPQNSIEEALKRAVKFFKENGYVK